MVGFIRIEPVIKMEGMVSRLRDHGWAMDQGHHWIRESLMLGERSMKETNDAIDHLRGKWGLSGCLRIHAVSRQGQ